MGCTNEMTPAVRVTRSSSAYGLERVRYYPRQLMTVEDMQVEQEYFRQKLRRHNRMLHGWGVVCGLSVSAAPVDGAPWQVLISEGYALSPQGDEIDLPDGFCFDLAKCGLAGGDNPCEPGRPAPQPANQRRTGVFLAIRYRECPTRPVRTQPGGCGCDGGDCEYSRIRDDFEIACLLDLPETHRPNRDQRDLCSIIREGETPPCPGCPEEPWVVLAFIQLPNKMDIELSPNGINNRARHILVSTAMLQQQVLNCCCQGD